MTRRSADPFAQLLGEIEAVVARALTEQLATQTPKRLLTVEEAGRALSLSRSATYELVLSGQLRSLKIGARRRVPVEALDEYVVSLEEVDVA